MGVTVSVNANAALTLTDVVDVATVTYVDQEVNAVAALATQQVTDIENFVNMTTPNAVPFHATTMNVDFANGNRVVVGNLTAAITAMPDPTNIPARGGLVQYDLTQNGTGGFGVVWSSKHKGSWPTGSGTANQKKSIRGRSDGTNILFEADSGWY